jgi:hypothetical protein
MTAESASLGNNPLSPETTQVGKQHQEQPTECNNMPGRSINSVIYRYNPKTLQLLEKMKIQKQ